jgi:hypothetical protein
VEYKRLSIQRLIVRGYSWIIFPFAGLSGNCTAVTVNSAGPLWDAITGITGSIFHYKRIVLILATSKLRYRIARAITAAYRRMSVSVMDLVMIDRWYRLRRLRCDLRPVYGYDYDGNGTTQSGRDGSRKSQRLVWNILSVRNEISFFKSHATPPLDRARFQIPHRSHNVTEGRINFRKHFLGCSWSAWRISTSRTQIILWLYSQPYQWFF